MAIHSGCCPLEGVRLAGIGGTDSMQAVAVHVQQPLRLIKDSS